MRFFSLFFLSFFIIVNAYKLQDAIKFQKKGKYKKAFQIYQQYKDNNLTALNNYAMMLYLGKGTKPDQAKAVNILKEAVKKYKNPKLMYNLANMYWYGYFDNNQLKAFIKRKDAVKLFKKSAKLGYKPAEIFLKTHNLLDSNITNASKSK